MSQGRHRRAVRTMYIIYRGKGKMELYKMDYLHDTFVEMHSKATDNHTNNGCHSFIKNMKRTKKEDGGLLKKSDDDCFTCNY